MLRACTRLAAGDPRWPHRGMRAAVVAVQLLWLSISPASAEQPVAIEAADGLTVAIVDLAEIPELAPRPPAQDPRPAWRTTFGSERVTEPAVKAMPAGPLTALADADIVLLQGVQAAAKLRRMFPPRAWRLIVSRDILSPADPVGFRTVRSDLPRTTAIAVKARQDLRVTARTFSLRLGEESATQIPGSPEAAATAVRLVDRGRTLWLASIALPAACSIEDPPCPALSVLDTWRAEKLKSGEPTVIGGRMKGSGSSEKKQDAAPPACASHTIESDLAWRRLPSTGPDSHDSETGCISIVRIVN